MSVTGASWVERLMQWRDRLIDLWDELAIRAARLAPPPRVGWPVLVVLVYALPMAAYRSAPGLGVVGAAVGTTLVLLVGLATGFWATRHPEPGLQESQWRLWLKTMWWVHLSWLLVALVTIVMSTFALLGDWSSADEGVQFGLNCTAIPAWIVGAAIGPVLWSRAWARRVLAGEHINDPRAANRLWAAVFVTSAVNIFWAAYPMYGVGGGEVRGPEVDGPDRSASVVTMPADPAV